MGEFIDKRIYSTNIFIIIIFTLSILYLLQTNLDINKKNTYIKTYTQTEYLTQFISSDLDRLVHGVHELLKGLNITEEHIHNDVNHEKLINNLLKNRLEEYMLSLVMTDEKGEIIHWSQEGKKLDIQNREYIKYHLKNKDINNSLFVDEGRLSIAIEDKAFFAISKGFYQNKKLKNIIIAYMDIDYLIKRYKKNLINQTITITSENGHIYFRVPGDTTCCGIHFKEIDDFSNSGKEKNDLVIVSTLDKKSKVASFIRSKNFPIITSVEVDEEVVLKEWKIYRLSIWTISLLIILAAILLIFYYTRIQKKVDILTQLDSLTNIYNRGFFNLIANKEFSKAKRFNQTLLVLMIDIDDFKNINDTYGHQAGDKVIKKIAKILKDNTREIDSCGRFGGEEFIVLLPQTDLQGAYLVAKRIKENFKKINKEDEALATVSIGISNIDEADKDIDAIIKRADTAMYISKKEGKDRITTLP